MKSISTDLRSSFTLTERKPGAFSEESRVEKYNPFCSSLKIPTKRTGKTLLVIPGLWGEYLICEYMDEQKGNKKKKIEIAFKRKAFDLKLTFKNTTELPVWDLSFKHTCFYTLTITYRIASFPGFF
ncbi:MAG: hypothetical protein ACE5QV_02280 [Fidelibacterota bacterium]